jgi:hypothetical protein
MGLCLKKTILVSLVGHLAAFGIFSFSFGNKILKREYSPMSFLGQILRDYDLALPKNIPAPAGHSIRNFSCINTNPLASRENDYGVAPGYNLKPMAKFSSAGDKAGFLYQSDVRLSYPKKKEPAIIFHPLLPYHFLLYFKDRQAVHIELSFNRLSALGSIIIKRKISSGNLEADLLAMRYIGHFFYIGKERFVFDRWNTVKIDLSEKND